MAQPPSAGHPSVRVTVPVYGEPAGPMGIVKVCVVVMLPGAGAMDSEEVEAVSREEMVSRVEVVPREMVSRVEVVSRVEIVSGVDSEGSG